MLNLAQFFRHGCMSLRIGKQVLIVHLGAKLDERYSGLVEADWLEHIF